MNCLFILTMNGSTNGRIPVDQLSPRPELQLQRTNPICKPESPDDPEAGRLVGFERIDLSGIDMMLFFPPSPPPPPPAWPPPMCLSINQSTCCQRRWREKKEKKKIFVSFRPVSLFLMISSPVGAKVITIRIRSRQQQQQQQRSMLEHGDEEESTGWVSFLGLF